MTLHNHLVALAVAALLVSACSAPSRRGDSPRTEPGALLTPPPALKMSGVEPVPQALATTIGGYTQFRGIRLVDWQPQGHGLLVGFERNGRVQLHHLETAGAPLRPLTDAAEPTRVGQYVPAQPNLVVLARDAGGDEAARIYRLDLQTGIETALTPPGRRYDTGPFNQAGTAFFASSVPLDRSTGDSTLERAKTAVTTEIVRIDPVAGTSSAVVSLPGTGWYLSDVSRDERTLLIIRFRSVTDAELWSLEIGQPAPKRVLPRDGEPTAFHGTALFAFDDSIFVVTDRGSEFRELKRLEPASGRIDVLTGDIPWDVDGSTFRSIDARLRSSPTRRTGYRAFHRCGKRARQRGAVARGRECDGRPVVARRAPPRVHVLLVVASRFDQRRRLADARDDAMDQCGNRRHRHVALRRERSDQLEQLRRPRDLRLDHAARRDALSPASARC